MFEESSSYQDFCDEAKARGACREALNFSKRWKSLTFGEAFSQPLTEEERIYWNGWAIWGVQEFLNELSSNLRESFFHKVVDPMCAFRLYLKLRELLSEEEEQILKLKFKGKLPTAEKEFDVDC